MTSRKGQIIDFLEEAQKKKAKTTIRAKKPSISQSITGNHNMQAGRDLNIVTQKMPDIKVLPPPESIGGNVFLKKTIQDLFGKIGEARMKNHPETAFAVMYNIFKKDFDIPSKKKWTEIWSWPVECADSIIEYLQGKYSNTIQGRIEKAAKKEGYLDTRPQLYKKEKDLLSHFGLTADSGEVREQLFHLFRVRSHKDMTRLQHWFWVKHLEKLVDGLESV